MALDFPSNPQTNDVYTYNSKSWVWNGSIWKALNQGIQGTQGIQGAQGIQGVTGIQGAQGIQGLKGTKVTASDTAPLSPSINDFWWDSQTGDLMVYYDDGNTQQWVGATSGITGIQGIQGTQGIQGITGVAGPSTVLNATNDTSSATLYPVMLNASGSDQTPKVTTGSLTFNAATGTLSSTRLSISGQSLTGSANTSIIDSSATWNTTGTPTAIKLNITDTASNANSLLMDLQVGGSSKFWVYKNGDILTQTYAKFGGSTGQVQITNNSSGEFLNLRTGLWSASPMTINWNAQGNGTNNYWDTRLGRDGIGTLAQYGNTAATGGQSQSYRIYNLYTSSTNYERIGVNWTSNVAQLYTEKGSAGGTSRDLVLGTNATTAITIDATTQNVTIAKKLNTAASTTSAASVNVPHGTAPASPVDGDMWTTSAGLYVQVNGVTVGPLGAGSASGFETSFLLMGA